MTLPTQPVTLTVDQIDELNRKLGVMRHDVNNHLSLILAAAELVRYKPDMAQKMMENVVLQPPRISASIAQFSAEFENAYGITKP